jgi:hypothetical protein
MNVLHGAETDPLDVKRLGAINVGDGNGDHLKSQLR